MTKYGKMQPVVMRVLTVMLVTSFIMAVVVMATPVQTALAGGTSCTGWTWRGCCDSWWPGLQDYYSRECYNLNNHWTEWGCRVISGC